MSLVRQFTDQNFSTEVIDASQNHPVLVDFWAPWCGPCRLVGPTLDEVADNLQAIHPENGPKVGKLNIDENSEMARQFQIASIPTVLVFYHGVVVERLVGVQSKQSYLEAIERASAKRVA